MKGGTPFRTGNSDYFTESIEAMSKLTACCLCLIGVFSCLHCVQCDVDLKAILTQAAQKVAEEAGTSLDAFALAGGLCFSAEDEGPGDIKCQSQAAGMFRMHSRKLICLALKPPCICQPSN